MNHIPVDQVTTFLSAWKDFSIQKSWTPQSENGGLNYRITVKLMNCVKNENAEEELFKIENLVSGITDRMEKELDDFNLDGFVGFDDNGNLEDFLEELRGDGE